MPITTSLDSHARVIRMVMTGTLTLREMTAAIDAVVAEIGDEGGYDLLSTAERWAGSLAT